MITMAQIMHILKEENTPQNNPHHCFDVKDHSVATMYHMIDMGYKLNEEHLSDIMIAALLHDIGKKSVKGINKKTGFDTFYGHAKKGIETLKEKGINLSETALFLIEHHDDRMNNKAPECDTPTFIILCDLMKADLLAQHPVYQAKEKMQELTDWIEKFS